MYVHADEECSDKKSRKVVSLLKKVEVLSKLERGRLCNGLPP